jgi:fimbrial chaperone protein
VCISGSFANSFLKCSAILGLIYLTSFSSEAATWNVEPIRVELSSEQTTSVITITNEGDQPTSIQVLLVAWSQEQGKDIYLPSKDLIISPPIFTIHPKQNQILRVGLRQRLDWTGEMSYRIYLQELPAVATNHSSAVQVALRISLPVFVQTQKGIAAPKTIWRIQLAPEKTLLVTLENQGNAHIQISDLALYLSGGELPIASETVSSYVLTGQRHQWILKLNTNEDLRGAHLRLKAYTDYENIDKEMELEDE